VLIDWFTVGVQLFNFLFLVWLLKRVLYRPILQAIERRQQRIEDWYREAQQKRDEAQQDAERYRRQCWELQERKAQMLDRAKVEAREEREKLFAQVREEVDRVQHQWQASLRRRQNQFFDRLRRETTHHLSQMTRRALEDVADAKLEERAIERFIDRLHRLDDDTKLQMHQALVESRSSVLTCTGFELPQNNLDSPSEMLRERLFEAVKRELAWDIELCWASELPETETPPDEDTDEPPPVPLQFVCDRAPICGVELYVGGYEVAWSLDRYLRDLEERVRETLQSEIDREEVAEVDLEAQLQRQLARQTYEIVRRALKDMADADLEQQTIAVFLRRLERLDGKTREQLARSIDGKNCPITVRSNFEISPAWQERIRSQLHDIHLADKNPVEFSRSSDTICGIQVQVGDCELSWSLEDYLEGLDRDSVFPDFV